MKRCMLNSWKYRMWYGSITQQGGNNNPPFLLSYLHPPTPPLNNFGEPYWPFAEIFYFSFSNFRFFIFEKGRLDDDDVSLIDTIDNSLFCLADVCKVLDLDASQVVRRLESTVLSKHPVYDSLGRATIVLPFWHLQGVGLASKSYQRPTWREGGHSNGHPY